MTPAVARAVGVWLAGHPTSTWLPGLVTAIRSTPDEPGHRTLWMRLEPEAVEGLPEEEISAVGRPLFEWVKAAIALDPDASAEALKELVEALARRSADGWTVQVTVASEPLPDVSLALSRSLASLQGAVLGAKQAERRRSPRRVASC